MVFEHLFPEQLLEQKHWTAFILAAIYSTISIIIARLLFPANSGIVSIAFLSIFLIPYFKKLLRNEEKRELSETKFSIKQLFTDNWGMIKIYLFIFMGVYLTYMLYAFLAPTFGYDVTSVFREQLSLESLRGGASFSFSTFSSIFLNNWWVLLACFLIALIAGDGAIFFVAWNASTWGTIFGYRAFAAGMVDGTSALIALATIVIITLPHVLIEGGAYILAAIAGGVISDEVDNKEELKFFVLYFLAAVLVYVVAYIVAKLMGLPPLLMGLFAIIVAIGILHTMQHVFDSPRNKLVFKYNFYLFLIAIGVFFIGGLIETFVLYNADSLRYIYTAAAAFGG